MAYRRIQPIETNYAGHKFRSRVEARWAVALDTLGIRYEYEPEGYELGDLGRYLPDFWLPGLKTWLEIKPSNFTLFDSTGDYSLESKRLALFGANIGHPFYVLVGPPKFGGYKVGHVHTDDSGVCAIFERDIPNIREALDISEDVELLNYEEIEENGAGHSSPCACYSGWVFITFEDENGEERDGSYRCRRCGGEER
jgi:hypothetical protein